MFAQQAHWQPLKALTRGRVDLFAPSVTDL